MPGPLHTGIIELLRDDPELVLALCELVRPELAELFAGDYLLRVRDPNLRVRTFSAGSVDKDRLGDLVITLHPADDPSGSPSIVLVVECQLAPDPRKLYVWIEYLAAARRIFEAAGRILVLSPVERVITWAHGAFDGEPHLRPILIGREAVPVIDDHGRALREPTLAILSAVFHGAHERGDEVASAAALALLKFPPHLRRRYAKLLAAALPEDRMQTVRDIAFEEAQEAADEWLRNTGPYQMGHREGREDGRAEGRGQGREEGLWLGLLQGRREALALVFELRGLVPSANEQARIDACTDGALLERWCQQAKTAASVAELLAND